MNTFNSTDTAGHRNRVRQKFLACDGDYFSDYELLELLLILALPRRDVKALAKELLRQFGSFAEVIYAPPAQLAEIKWVKNNIITLFKAVAAATRRICWQKLTNSDIPVILNTDVLIDYCRAAMAYNDVEELRIIYLNAALKAVDTEILQKGSLTNVSIDPREIIRRAMDKKAPSIILVHNHPSDNVTPSANDIKMTKNLADACKLMRIKLQEHIIIGKSDYFSFSENGMISN